MLITASPTAWTVINAVVTPLVFVMLVGLGVLFLRRWRAAGPAAAAGARSRSCGPARRSPRSGLLDSLAVQVGRSRASSSALDWPLLIAICAVPLGFLAGLMRASLSRAGAVSDLVETLGRRSRGRPRRARHGARRSDARARVLAAGARALRRRRRPRGAPARGGRERAATEIEHDGRPVAALVHDAALLDQPELVRAAGAAAALALENERLDAELRARCEDLRASRARLVEASDAARRRIERDLHDGAQQRFVSLALTLRLARNRLDGDSEAGGAGRPRARGARRRPLGAARARARHPPGRAQRARAGAGARVARRARARPGGLSVLPAQRLPAPVETAAYFLVAEALTNVARYARRARPTSRVMRENGRAVIEVRDDGVGGADPTSGSGLRGIADRVAALDGRLHVSSPAGGGTVVRAEIPVA